MKEKGREGEGAEREKTCLKERKIKKTGKETPSLNGCLRVYIPFAKLHKLHLFLPIIIIMSISFVSNILLLGPSYFKDVIVFFSYSMHGKKSSSNPFLKECLNLFLKLQ